MSKVLRGLMVGGLVMGVTAGTSLGEPGAAAAPAAAPAATPAAKPAQGMPSGLELHNRFIEATGGRAAHEKLKFRVAEATMSFPAMGLTGKMTVTQAQPNKIRVLTDMTGVGKMDQGHNGSVAWELNPMTGPRLIEGEELEEMLRQGSMTADLNPEKTFKSMVTEGIEDVDGKPAYRVTCTPMSGPVMTRFYDKESSLLVKQSITVKGPLGEMPSVTFMSDYKDVDGVKIAHKALTRVMETQEFSITTDKVEHPASLPADAFEPPAEVKDLLNRKAAPGAAPAAPAPAPAPAPTQPK